MNKIIKLFLFIILIWLINQSFWYKISNESWLETKDYSADSWVTDCSTRENISWLKKIPSSNNSNAHEKWSITCIENPYFWVSFWTIDSGYIKKNNPWDCNQITGDKYWYVNSITCFNNSNNEK
jgi:hypothetical protein